MKGLSKSKYVMSVSNCLSAIHYKLRHTEFITYAYLIFLSGFFLSPNNHLHRNFYYLFVIAPFLICLDSKFIRDCIRSTLFKLSLLFLLYFLTSMFWSDAQLFSEEIYDLSRFFLMLVMFIMVTVMLSSTSEKFFNKINLWLCFVAIIAAVSFIAVFYSSHRFPRDRLSGLFDYVQNPNQGAMFFGFVGIIAFSSAYFSKITWQKIFYWIACLTIFVYILLSQSRGPLLSFIISIMVGSLFGKNWKAIGIFITLFAVFIIAVEFFDVGIRSFYERGLSHRIELWTGAINNIAQAPLFGNGYFSNVNIPIGNKTHSPHNVVLLVSSKSGMIGGGLLLLLITTAFVHSYKFFLVTGNWIFLCIFAYFTACMTFDSTHLLHKPTLGWLIFWMPVALLAAEEIRCIPIKSKNG